MDLLSGLCAGRLSLFLERGAAFQASGPEAAPLFFPDFPERDGREEGSRMACPTVPPEGPGWK